MNSRTSFFILMVFGIFCLGAFGAQNSRKINTSDYEKRLETIQKNEKIPENQRDLAKRIVKNLKEKNFNTALANLERLVRADRKSKSALEARMILCELTLRTSGNVLAAQRQFRPMTEAQKGLSVDRWLNQSNVFTEEKNPNVRQAYAAFLSSVGDWADRAKHPNAEKIRFLAASLIPKQNGNRNAAPVYEKVARSSRDAETREKALFDMAIAHLNSDRFSEALAALHRVNSPKSMERRFDTVIQVCQKNPDSLAALRHLRQEQSFCPVGPLRSRFDISIAQIHLREEHYEAAEAHLLAADAQYSYAAVMDDLKKRYESEKKAGEQLRKRIAERIKDLNQGKIKP